MPARHRIKWTLFATQSLGSAGFLISSTITPILGAALAGRPSWAGVPAAFYWAGGAGFAFLWGRLMDTIGRRWTLVTGLCLGVLGAGFASRAVVAGTFWGFVGGLILMGSAQTALQLARFVAAEVHPRAERGRAIATVVLGGTIGGVAGPLLVAPMSVVATSLALPALAGPYWASMAFFFVGAVVVALLLRPEPRDLALRLEADTALPGAEAHRHRPVREILRDRWVQVAMLSMLLGQGMMSTLMVISSLHMKDHGHALGSISVAMSSHVIGMYAFSILTGRLADVWGRGRLIAAGGVLLSVAGLGATVAVRLAPMSAVLLLLGLGWNACYVGGSTLLSDRLSQLERARIQSINDSLLTTASALGSLLSGVVFAWAGYAVIGFSIAALSLVPTALGWRFRSPAGQSPKEAAAEGGR